MSLSSSVTLRWTTTLPFVHTNDAAEDSIRTPSPPLVSSTPHPSPTKSPFPDGADASASDVFLVSDAIVRVSRELLLPQTPDPRNGDSEWARPQVPSLRGLLWLTTRHCLERVELEIEEIAEPPVNDAEAAVSAASPERAAQTLVLHPHQYTIDPFDGNVIPFCDRVLSSTPPPSETHGSDNAANEEEDASSQAQTTASVLMPPQADTSRGVEQDDVTAGADGSAIEVRPSSDALVLTLDFLDVSSTEVSTTHADPSPSSVVASVQAVKRPREDDDDDIAPVNEVGGDVPIKCEETADEEHGAAAPPDTALPVAAEADRPRRRLRLFLGSSLPSKCEDTLMSDISIKPEPLPDVNTTSGTTSNTTTAATAAKPARMLSLRGAVAVSAPPDTKAETAAAAPSTSSTRQLRLLGSSFVKPELFDNEDDDATNSNNDDDNQDDDGESIANAAATSVSCASDVSHSDDDAITKDEGSPSSSPLPSLPLAVPHLLCIRGNPLDSVEEGEDVVNAFFAHPQWPARVRTVVLFFAAANSVPSQDHVDAWQAQDLTRLLCRPRTAPRLTRSEIQNGPARRHLHLVSHPRFSAAVCPQVSSLVSIQSALRGTDSTVVKNEEEGEEEDTPQWTITSVEVRGYPHEPFIRSCAMSTTAPLLLSSEDVARGRDDWPQPQATTTTAASRSESQLTLLEALPLTASNMHAIVHLHTVLLHAESWTVPNEEEAEEPEEADEDTNDDSTDALAPQGLPRLAPLGALTRRRDARPSSALAATATPTDAQPTPSAVPTRDHSLQFQGTHWSVQAHLDGNTWSLTPDLSSSPAVADPWPRVRYMVCDLCVGTPLEMVQRLAPLHFLLLHIEAWWQRTCSPDVTRGTKKASETLPLPPITTTTTPRELAVRVCGTVNWALDTQRGTVASPSGITLVADLVQLVTGAYVAVSHTTDTHDAQGCSVAPQDAVKAIAAIASVVCEHHLRFGAASDPPSAPWTALDDATTRLALQARAQALGSVYTLYHLPHPWQSYRLLVAEASPLSKPMTTSAVAAEVPPGLASSLLYRRGTGVLQTPIRNVSALGCLEADQHRLIQWCRGAAAAAAFTTTGTTVREPHETKRLPLSRAQLPALMRHVLSCSAWRAPFVVDYFARSDGALRQRAVRGGDSGGVSLTTSSLFSSSRRREPYHLVQLYAKAPDTCNARAPLVRLQLRADVTCLNVPHAQSDSASRAANTNRLPTETTTATTTLKDTVNASAQGLALPLTGLLFAIESRCDVATSLAELSALFAHEDGSPSRAREAFRVVLYEAAPLTWQLDEQERAVPTSSSGASSRAEPLSYTCPVAFANPYGVDAQRDAMKMFAWLFSDAPATAAPSSASRTKTSKTAHKSAGNVMAIDGGDGDDDGDNADDGEETTDAVAEKTETEVDTTTLAPRWAPVALLPLIAPAPNALLTYPTTHIALHSLARYVSDTLGTHAHQLVQSLANADAPVAVHESMTNVPAKKQRGRKRKTVPVAVADPAVDAARRETVDGLARQLTALWQDLFVAHLTGHALLWDRYTATLMRLKDEVEARADCLPTSVVVAAVAAAAQHGSYSSTHDDGDDDADENCDGSHLVASGLLLLDQDVAAAYRSTLGVLAEAHRDAPALSAAVQSLRSSPAHVEACVAPAAEAVLRRTHLEMLRRETSNALALVNVSLTRWRARFNVKAELKHAPPARPPVEVDVTALTALADRGASLGTSS